MTAMADSVESALVTSHLDYVNSILYDTLKNVTRLQWAQNALARIVAYQRTNISSSSTLLALLKQLQWLPIKWHIQFKLDIVTFKTLHTNRPPYLTDTVQYYQPARCLPLSGSHQLVIPQHNLSLGSPGFSIPATHIWNSVPINTCKIQSVSTFRRHLKTLLSASLFYPKMTN